MTTTRAAVLLAAAALFSASGCGTLQGESSSANEVERNVADVELKAKEGQTLSALAKLEDSLRAYVKAERKIPEKLDELVPKYIAEIPAVAIGSHRGESAKVRVYPPTVLRDGRVDGTKLRDSGGWGYVFNDRQVVVFVNCSHKASSGRAWYLERGAF